MSGLSLRLASSAEAARAAICASGTLFAPRAWPAPNSALSRTSTSSASSRLRSCVACAVLTHGPPKPRRRNGQTSIAPETTATAMSRRLLRTKSTEPDIIIQRMHKLVLLRHGESDWNRENRFTGWTDVDLSARGVEEA